LAQVILIRAFSDFDITPSHCGSGSVMAKQMNISETHDSKTEMESQCKADHADEQTQVNLWSVVDGEMEAQSEPDQSDKSESDSESPSANDSSANCKECWKFIFYAMLWKVLSLICLVATLWGSYTTGESVDIAAMFNLDVECCAGQAAGSTALCIKANACLPCESLISDTVSKESVGNFSSFASGINACVGQVAGVVQIPGKGFSKKHDTCKLVASLACDSELRNNQIWKNVSQGRAISLDPEFAINSVSHNIWRPILSHANSGTNCSWSNSSAQAFARQFWDNLQHLQEKIAKSSIPQWSPLWPSLGVSSVLLAISVKLIF